MRKCYKCRRDFSPSELHDVDGNGWCIDCLLGLGGIYQGTFGSSGIDLPWIWGMAKYIVDDVLPVSNTVKLLLRTGLNLIRPGE